MTWPPSCTTGVYSPATNTCVPTGTAANPGGTPGQTQINAGGSTFVGIPGSLTDLTYGWKTQGGIQYAKGWQSGGGNNGIVNCLNTPGQTCVADPSYALTETPLITSFTASPLHYQNLRGGWQDDFYRNPQYANHDYFNTGFQIHQQGHGETCSYDQDLSYVGNNNLGCFSIGQQSLVPGFSQGNTPGTAGFPNWSITTTAYIDNMIRTSGISEALTVYENKTGVGDNVAVYATATGPGGFTAASDEATKAGAFSVYETATLYTANCLSGCTTGSTKVKLNVANGAQGNSRYVINQTAGPSFSGLYTNVVAGLGGFSAVTVDQTVPVSNAWGTVIAASTSVPPANIIPGLTPPFSTVVTFGITVTSGVFNTTGLMCFAGDFHEQAIPTAVSTAGGVATVTVALRRPHANATLVMQGGMCGQGFEATAYTYNTATGGGPMRYTFDVVGSTNASTLIVGAFATSVGGNITGNLANNTVVYNLTTATQSFGPTISGVISGSSPYTSGGSSLILSGLTASSPGDSPMNGLCTNLQFTINSQFTCTHAGLTGNNVTTSTGTASLGQNGFNTWPIAEVIDIRGSNTYNVTAYSITSNTVTLTASNDLSVGTYVLMAGFTSASFLNNQSFKVTAATSSTFAIAFTHANVGNTADIGTASVNPPQADGTIALEPNVMPVNLNDSLQELNHYSGKFQSHTDAVSDNNPYATGVGMAMQFSGRGAAANAAALYLYNNQPDSAYLGNGGNQQPPTVLNWALGPYNTALSFNHAPAQDASFIYINPATVQSNNPSYFYYYTLANGKAGTNLSIRMNPYYGDVTLGAGRLLQLSGTPIVYNSDFGSQTFRGPLVFGTAVAPTLTLTPKTSGGVLADGSYCYKIQVRGATVNSVFFFGTPSVEACTTITGGGGNGSVQMSWNPVVGSSTSYIIFGRLTGAEGQLSDGVIQQGYGYTAYLDTGKGTIGSAPSASPIPGIDFAGYLGVQSTGTTAEVKIVSAAGAGGTTMTIPVATGVFGLGLTIPQGTPTLTAGTNVTSCACAASYTCTNTRGRLTIVGGTATTGTICTITFSASLTTAPFLTVGEMGATSLHGLDHGVPSATSVTVTAASSVSGATLNVDYEAQP